MDQQPKYNVGHPAYSGDNRVADNLTTGEAIKTLESRGVNSLDAIQGLWKADTGTHVTLRNKVGSVIELVRRP